MIYDEEERDQLTAYLAGQLDSKETEAIEYRLCTEDDLARLMIKVSCEESIISEWVALQKTALWSFQIPTPSSIRPFLLPAAKFLVAGLLLLAVTAASWVGIYHLAAPFFITASQQPLTPVAESVAIIKTISEGELRSQNILFVANDHLKTGQQFFLEKGRLELEMDSGAEIMIAAPATFQMTGKNEIFLSRGMLMAEVLTEAGKGFTVKTPSSINVDLGTVFGIAVDQKGISVTQVFQGTVTSTNRHFSIEDSPLPDTLKLTSNGRVLHRGDGTSTQKIKNLAEHFFVKFDHPGSSSNKTGMKYRVAKLIGIDKTTAKHLRKQQKENPVSVTELASLEEDVLLANQTENEADSTTSFYNSFDNDLAIEMGGAIKNAKSGPQFANLTYEEGGVLIKEGSRLSFETAGRLNNKKGHISFRIKPNWDGATDKQARSFFSAGPFRIGKWYRDSSKHAKPYLFFRFDSGKGEQNEVSLYDPKTVIVESWKKGTWHTIEVEWDLTLPQGQQYMTLTLDGLFSKTIAGNWRSVQSLAPIFTIGAGNRFQQSADAVFNEIYIDTKLKGYKK